MTYASVCSGIECMSAACADLPMKPVFFSEIEPFPCAVLKSHFPNVPNLGDMSKIEVTNDGKKITNGSVRIVLNERLDIFAGGTPCQDVSVAGKRSGMQEGSGTRSSLAFEFVRLVRELKPRYVLWENVAGVLSDKSFPEFLSALANCGYGVAYRTLDAQWVRVADCYHEDGRVVGMERAIPQRRRRVWVVGCAGGDVAKAAEILFEHKSIVGDNPPRRLTRQEIAATAGGRDRVHDRVVGGAPGDGAINTFCETGHGYWMSHPYAETNRAEGENRPSRPCNVAVESQCIALDGDKLKPRENPRKGGNGFGINEDGASYTLTVPDRHGVAYNAMDVQSKRIYPTEGVAPCLPSGGTEGMTIQPSVLIKRTNPNGEEVANTITRQMSEQSGQDARANAVVECYRIDAKSSNSMKSANPHSGFHKAEVSACLDTTIPEPSKAQGGNVVVECYENHAQDSRVRPITVAPTIPQKAGTGGNNLPLAVFNKVSHPRGKDGDGERWAEDNVASTRNVFDIGETRTQECVVTHHPAKEVLDLQGGKIGAHYTEDNSAPTLTHGRGSASDIHAVTMVSTNSNGGDVMPTLTNDLAKQTGKQQADRGGTLSMNFEMYDKAEDVNVSICAKRARDCMVIIDNNKE